MGGYVKVFGSILKSTVWRLPLATKVVWMTMLADCDRDGIVEASIPGLADLAKVTVEQCEAAILCFMAPDTYSRTKDFEGRRIEEIDGGWRILNYEKYRDKLSIEHQKSKAAERQKRWRDRHNGVTPSNAPLCSITPSNPIAETSAKPSAESKEITDSFVVVATTLPAVLTFPCNGKPDFWALTQEQVDRWSQLYPGTDVLTECRKALAWVEANQRKTAKGMPKFLNAWIGRTNDKGGGQKTSRSNQPTASIYPTLKRLT